MELAICTCTQASRVLAEGFRRRGCWSVQQRNARLTLPASPAAAPGNQPSVCSSVLLFKTPARPRTVPGAREVPISPSCRGRTGQL